MKIGRNDLINTYNSKVKGKNEKIVQASAPELSDAVEDGEPIDIGQFEPGEILPTVSLIPRKGREQFEKFDLDFGPKRIVDVFSNELEEIKKKRKRVLRKRI